MKNIIDYERDNMTIKNLNQLPRGLGAKLLLVIDSPYPGEYIAKRWLRKMPTSTARGESILRL